MELTGKVVDQANGQPIAGVQIWEIDPTGQNAQAVGFSGVDGSYDVFINNAGSTVNFVIDGYTGTVIPASQAMLSDQVLLAKDGSVSAKLTLSGVPAWVWLLLAGIGIFYFDGHRKIR
jgi:hypothetical protein